TRELFRQAFADGHRRRWRLNHSPLFLDFLEGKADFGCTAWGIPSYSVFGWQRPCYLMSDGYASTYKELVETTDWTRYGRGHDLRGPLRSGDSDQALREQVAAIWAQRADRYSELRTRQTGRKQHVTRKVEMSRIGG